MRILVTPSDQKWKIEWEYSFSSTSLRSSSPIWASETSLARTSEWATKPRGAEERRVSFPGLLARAFSRGSLRLPRIGELARRLFVHLLISNRMKWNSNVVQSHPSSLHTPWGPALNVRFRETQRKWLKSGRGTSFRLVLQVLHQAWGSVFHHQKKHREESWKYDAQPIRVHILLVLK